MKYTTKSINSLPIGKIFLFSFIFATCLTISLSAQPMTSAQKKTFKKNFKEGTLLIEANTGNRDDERMADTTLKFFQRCYALDSTNCNVAYIIGKLYLATAMHKAAALPYLQKAVTNIKKKYHPSDPSEKHAPPMAYYYLAQAQAVNYQFDNAIENFNTFKKMLKSDGGERPKDIAMRTGWASNAKDLMANPVDCRVVNIGETVNSTYDDYAPVLTADEAQMYFASKRPMVEDTANDREGIWSTIAGQNKVWAAPTDPGAPLNVVGGNSATVSLTPDGQQMMVYVSEGVGNGEVYVTKLKGNTWTVPGKIDSSKQGVIDSKGSKYFTPSACLSPDGKTLYFSSDRAGGQGKLDLYRSDLQSDGTWGSPQNLGTGINTKEDEDCPFVSYDGSLLFFSSKGHNTMGGYDIFMCKADGQGGWGDPQNLGYPVNTPDDDKFFVLSADGKRGYYNTVRLGTMGERDIYEVTFKNPLPVQCVGVMVGYYKTADGSAIPADAKVTCSDGTNSTSAVVNSATGKYLVLLKPNVNYAVTITAGGNSVSNYNIMVPGDSAYCKLGRAFISNGGKAPVPPPTPPTPVAVDKFGSAPYFVKYFGYNLDEVTSNDPDFPTLMTNINNAIKDGTKIVVSIESSSSTVPTTKFGSNDKLAMARAEAVKKALAKDVKNATNVRFELKPSVNGPAYGDDYENHAKYEKYQYVKAYIREDK